MPTTDPTVQQAIAHCREQARRHYENFPVASRLLPRAWRDAVAVIYAFARTADDFADEGDLTPAQRLARLDAWAQRLRQPAAEETDPVLLATEAVIQAHHLPRAPFLDLLAAFRQDVTTRRYPDFAALHDYCRRSAHPVGRLLLHLAGEATPVNLAASDRICTALQLINFLQDLQQDYREHGRIYLPEDEMREAGVSEHHFAEGITDVGMQRLVERQIRRARTFLQAGAMLGANLSGRFGLEIRLIVQAAFTVLDRLANHGGDVFRRPRLRRRDYAGILWRAVVTG